MTAGNKSLWPTIRKVILIGFGLGLLYYLVDAFAERYVFHRSDSLQEEIFLPGWYEIYRRGSVLLILTAFAAFAQFSIRRMRRTREYLRSQLSARMRAEKALRGSEKQLREITAALGEGVYVLDKEGCPIFMNPAAERLWGWKYEELKGKSVHDAVHYQHADGAPFRAADCPMLGVLKTGVTYRTEDDVFTRKDGSIFPVAYVVTPIMEKGEVIATVSVFQDITERKQTELLSEALDDINGIIHSTLEFEFIMQRVKVEAARAVGCEAAIISLQLGNRWQMRYLHGLPVELTDTCLTGSMASLFTSTARARKAVAVTDTRRDNRIDPQLAALLGIRSILSVPLVVKDEVIGVMSFAYRSGPFRFSSAQVDFALKAAASVSLAMENARLYDVERNIADTLQEAILALPDRIPGIEIGHLYRSATEAAEVGGDFYDLFELEHRRVGITIGDVSGKGLEAAALTSLIKNTIKAYAHVYESPALIMDRANHLVIKASDESTFATVVFGILDTRSGRFAWCRAGHPLPILKDERSRFLDHGSSPIGIFHDLGFTEGELHLRTGDTLILYTDGVIEARRGEALFGKERLLAIVAEQERCHARELPGRVYEAILDYSGGRLSDDVAILTVCLTGETNS